MQNESVISSLRRDTTISKKERTETTVEHVIVQREDYKKGTK
jgi:hypothetical protein